MVGFAVLVAVSQFNKAAQIFNQYNVLIFYSEWKPSGVLTLVYCNAASQDLHLVLLQEEGVIVVVIEPANQDGARLLQRECTQSLSFIDQPAHCVGSISLDGDYLGLGRNFWHSPKIGLRVISP